MPLRNLFSLFWGAVILLHPFFMRLPKLRGYEMNKDLSVNMAFIFAVIFSLAVFGSGPYKRLPKNIYISAILIMLVTFFHQPNAYSPAAQTESFMIFSGIALLFQASTWVDQKSARILMNFMCVSGLIQVGYVLLQKIIIPKYEMQPIWWVYELFGTKIKTFNLQNGGASGPLMHSTYSGAMFAMLTPLFLRKNWIFFLPIMLFGVYSMHSAMTYAATAAGLLSVAFLRVVNLKGSLTILTILTFTAGYFYLTSNGTSSPELIDGTLFDDQKRGFIWSRTIEFTHLKMIQPFIGMGTGFYADWFPVFQPMWRTPTFIERWTNPHNEYLFLWVNYGAVGVFGLYCLVRKVVSLSYKDSILGGALMAVIVNAFGNFTMHIAPVALVAILLYCLIISVGQFQEDHLK